MRYVVIVLLFMYAGLLDAQTLRGKVYNLKSVVKDIKVLNKTQNRLTITDKDGNFNIAAKINDTIAFESIFYNPKEVILKHAHFEDINVFEIKKITNALKEVEITNNLEAKFDSMAYYATISAESKKLSKKPLIKSGENLMPTLNLIQLSKGITKLFKRNNKELKNQLPLSYEQLESLFSVDSFFNEKLLINDLMIPKHKTMLFLEFCTEKGVRQELLLEGKEMELLEELVINSELFLILLDKYGKQIKTKD